jgi:GxxExxY protein
MKHEDLTKQIIGAAMEVLNTLRPGQDEKIYERALLIELQLRGLKTENQKQFSVTYKGHPIGTFIPDILVGDFVVVDPKVVSAFAPEHIAQMLGYLHITELDVGLLLNFKHAKLEWKRIIRNDRTPDEPPSV